MEMIPARSVVLEVDLPAICDRAAMITAYAAAKADDATADAKADDDVKASPVEAYRVDEPLLRMYAAEVLSEVAAHFSSAVTEVGRRSLTLRASRHLRPWCRLQANEALARAVLYGILARWYAMCADPRETQHRASYAVALDDLRIALWRRSGLRTAANG